METTDPRYVAIVLDFITAFSRQIEGRHVSADSLVSLLVLALARADVRDIGSNLYYIRHFSCGNVESGQLGYTLLTMEAVLHHIVTERTELALLSKENKALWMAMQRREFVEDHARERDSSSDSNRSSVTLGPGVAMTMTLLKRQSRTSAKMLKLKTETDWWTHCPQHWMAFLATSNTRST
jgi:hypothetical protein